ncbi:uncharacterized protein SPPG_00377 [Spizellomyces punctatus DAOM BR117]|uniref:Ubinuclein middle domain-containing protein n=1 Tax=Spizellomyces punctatus (strain DAOM BR117) TaxID=645134 RepID=A0A0L0HTJ5_SPIPD|nr:hypothetical protein, variant [Spizellomyces punctatus DAOM BR117]XP_016612701.1 uncharacterized protein SPPG_00377 [Spizellomyces punctatus DAOM BR117]KND04661.1 hypothetical protein, variant [Spizellomyces punctatus DAOM BR117]KND04662.1 hypothetical protein SPPG_00377 [Spizellomyces punctatus DAOM BR117]|eukprot:XP_016612700.1 hypothetical protein, variant [Spizellomyces punctatus DAOM BR117]
MSFPRMGTGHGDMPEEEHNFQKAIRIKIPFNKENPEANVFDYAQLVAALHGGASSSSGGDMPKTDTGSAGSDSEEDGEDENGQQPRKKKSAAKKIQEDYDFEDDFIDDSDLFYNEVGYVPPSEWNYGFFAWRGPVENFFEEYQTDLFDRDAPATAAKQKGKKKATAASAEKKTVNGADKKAKGTGETSRKRSKKAAVTAPASSAPTSPKVKRTNISPPESAKLGISIASPEPAKDTVTSTPEGARAGGTTITSIPNSSAPERRGPSQPADSATTGAPDNHPLGPYIIVPTRTDSELSEDDMPLADYARIKTTKDEPPVPQRKPSQQTKKRDRKEDKHTTLGPAAIADVAVRHAFSEPSKKKQKKNREKTAQEGLLAAPPLAISASLLEVSMGLSDPSGSKKSSSKSEKKSSSKKSSKSKRSETGFPRKVEQLLQHLEEKAYLLQPPAHEPLTGELRDCLHQAALTASNNSCLNASFFARVGAFLPYPEYYLRKIIGIHVIPKKLERMQPAIKQMYDHFRALIKETLTQNPIATQPSTSSAASPEGNDGSSKFPWTEDLRTLFWNLLCSEWEMAELDNEYHILTDTKPEFNESAVRKAVYGKVLSFWPEGMMTVETLSRTYSHMKRKLERRAASGYGGGRYHGAKPDPFKNNKRLNPRKSAPPILEGGPLGRDEDDSQKVSVNLVSSVSAMTPAKSDGGVSSPLSSPYAMGGSQTPEAGPSSTPSNEIPPRPPIPPKLISKVPAAGHFTPDGWKVEKDNVKRKGSFEPPNFEHIPLDKKQKISIMTSTTEFATPTPSGSAGTAGGSGSPGPIGTTRRASDVKIQVIIPVESHDSVTEIASPARKTSDATRENLGGRAMSVAELIG